MITLAGTCADTSLSNYGRFGAGSTSGGHSGGGHDTGTAMARQTYGSGELSGKMLLAGIIDNNKLMLF